MTPQELRDRTHRFSVDIINFCRGELPADTLKLRILTQLQDAGTSTASNYRAACRAQSRAAFVAKLSIALEEADECVGWLDNLAEAKLGPWRGWRRCSRRPPSSWPYCRRRAKRPAADADHHNHPVRNKLAIGNSKIDSRNCQSPISHNSRSIGNRSFGNVLSERLRRDIAAGDDSDDRAFRRISAA